MQEIPNIPLRLAEAESDGVCRGISIVVELPLGSRKQGDGPAVGPSPCKSLGALGVREQSADGVPQWVVGRGDGMYSSGNRESWDMADLRRSCSYST